MPDEVLELGRRLRDLNRSIRLLKQVHVGDRAALPTGALGLLMYVREHPTGCQGKALATRAGLDPSTVSRAVATLVEHGLVERRADPTDGRASVLVITGRGQETLAAAEHEYGDLLHRALTGWTAGEVTALAEAIGRFSADVDQALVRLHTRPTPRPDTLEAAR